MRSTSRRHFLAVLLFATTLVSLTAVPGLAQEQGATTTVAETATTAVVEQPAVSVVDAPPAPAEAPWTTKFLIPTGLLLAVLAVFVTSVQYFRRVVRNRYKVVE